MKEAGSKEEYRLKLWAFIAKKEVPRMAKLFSTSRHNTLMANKKVRELHKLGVPSMYIVSMICALFLRLKVALLCQREVKKVAIKSQKASKDVSSVQPRARRLMKEALVYWRRYEKVEREQRKRAEKEAMEQRKRDDEMREVCII